MRIHIETGTTDRSFSTRVGNVYACGGGRRIGKMMIVIHLTKSEQYEGQKALMLIVDNEGEPCGVTAYSASYLDDEVPIAFVNGIDDIDLTMVSL